MSKIILSEGEISKLQSNYIVINNDVKKQLNSFLIVVEINSENPKQLMAVINSANSINKTTLMKLDTGKD